MKKLTEMLTHNFGWKVLSLIAAVILWFVIVNITNPTTDITIPVLLKVEGEEVLRENNCVLLNADELKSTIINLRVRGSSSSLAQLKAGKGGDLHAYIDLTPIDISRSTEFGKRLPIRVKYSQNTDNYHILYSSQEQVEVIIDRYVSRSVPVTVEKTDEDAEGYISLEPVVTPPNVTVSGPMSYIGMIAEVKATVALNGATEGFEVVRPITVLNAEGGDISDILAVSEDEVSIFIGVETYAKIPISTPIIVGQVAEGYRVTSVSVSPREIEVEGNSADINALGAIRLMDVDVTGISRTKVETYDILAYLADTRLNIREGSESRVRVMVMVEKEITKEILVPVDKIEIKGMSISVSLPPGEVRSEVRGIASEIVEFEQSDFVSYIDVTDLEPGFYNLEVMLQTPDGIVQTAADTIEVIIGEPEEQAPEDGEQAEQLP